MKVVQVLQPQWLSYIYFIAIVVVVGGIVDYATALQLPQQEQKQLQDTDVNYTASGESSRSGAEIVVYPVATSNNNGTADDATSAQKQLFIDGEMQKSETLEKQVEGQKEEKQQSQQQQKRQQQQHQQQQIPVVVIPAIDASNNPPSTRVVRRLDETNEPPTQLVVAQPFDLPIVKKNLSTKKTTTNTSINAPSTPTVLPQQRQRSASSRSNSHDSRKSAVATPTTTSQRSNSFDSQAQSARQPTTTTRTTQTENAANVTKSQRRRDEAKRGRAQSQQSKAPAASTDASNRRNVNKRRQDGSAANETVVGATVKSKARKAPATATSTSTPTPATTTTVRPQINFNPFSFFSPSLWALSSPPKPASTKKPPKKYTPTPGVAIPTTTTAKAKKSGGRKNKVASTTTTATTTSTITTSTTTTTTRKPTTSKPTKPKTTTAQTTTITTQAPKKGTTDGPFRIALPTFNFFGAQAAKSDEPYTSEKDKRNTVQNLRTQFNCPRENEVRFQLFPKICKTDGDCTVWNRNELCCEIFGAKSCVSGVIKPLEETSHSPILGLIPRKCPSRPLAELWWQVQQCETDTDCWPRVCCPDGNKRYCRTSQPELETVPVPVKRSFNYLSEYLECTPAPPPIFDLHPKTCESTLDCFPNVCCQEAGLRHCRPPKKSLLTWMANVLNVDFVKRLAQNIVIK